MRKKEEILDAFLETTAQSKRDKVMIEVLTDIRDVFKDVRDSLVIIDNTLIDGRLGR